MAAVASGTLMQTLAEVLHVSQYRLRWNCTIFLSGPFLQIVTSLRTTFSFSHSQRNETCPATTSLTPHAANVGRLHAPPWPPFVLFLCPI